MSKLSTAIAATNAVRVARGRYAVKHAPGYGITDARGLTDNPVSISLLHRMPPWWRPDARYKVTYADGQTFTGNVDETFLASRKYATRITADIATGAEIPA